MVATERLTREIEASAGRLVPRSEELKEYGLFSYIAGPVPAWRPLAGCTLDERVIVLVHGLDEMGPVWDDLAPKLAAAGYDVVRFNYPDDQAIADSARLLDAGLEDLASAGVTRVDIVAHSMGGLVARETLTSPAHYAGHSAGHSNRPRIGRLIMMGTPNQGAALASLRSVAEVRERVVKWWLSPDRDYRRLLDVEVDGNGEAGRDLLPHSAFLETLNARGTPTGVEITTIAARLADESTLLGWIPSMAKSVMPASWEEQVRKASEAVGDGAVSLESSRLAGVEDFTELHANHRSMICGVPWFGESKPTQRAEPPAIGIILDRLARPLPQATTVR